MLDNRKIEEILYTSVCLFLRHTPVSYTHLDVYKRQTIHSPPPPNQMVAIQVVKLVGETILCLCYLQIHKFSPFNRIPLP